MSCKSRNAFRVVGLGLLILVGTLSAVGWADGAPVVEDPFQGQQLEPPQFVGIGKLNPSSPGELKAERMRTDLCSLWSNHAKWTREFQFSRLARLEGSEVLEARLLQNLQEIGEALKPYYGADAGNRLIELLQEHHRIAVELTEAVQKGHREDTYKYRSDGHLNAEDLAIFLNQVNPNWPTEELKSRLDRYLELTEDALNARLSEDGVTENRLYEEAEDQLIQLAEVLAEGIIKH
ncbi:hypothetical protein [Paenibacillus rubinfantis]|uniref:hypothetical protein n=1 Tax=Paenibacillus rubinfantis TaxID=1720296 RepID=UPI00073EDE83|nr:hypothetical protein [Paenibacillus rubinfantis]